MTSNISQNLWHIWEQAPINITEQSIQEAYILDPNRSLPNNRGGWETWQRDRTTLPFPSYLYNGEIRSGRTFEPTPDQYSWWGPPTLAAPFIPQVDLHSLRQGGTVAEDGVALNEPPQMLFDRLAPVKEGLQQIELMKRKRVDEVAAFQKYSNIPPQAAAGGAAPAPQAPLYPGQGLLAALAAAANPQIGVGEDELGGGGGGIMQEVNQLLGNVAAGGPVSSDFVEESKTIDSLLSNGTLNPAAALSTITSFAGHMYDRLFSPDAAVIPWERVFNDPNQVVGWIQDEKSSIERFDNFVDQFDNKKLPAETVYESLMNLQILAEQKYQYVEENKVDSQAVLISALSFSNPAGLQNVDFDDLKRFAGGVSVNVHRIPPPVEIQRMLIQPFNELTQLDRVDLLSLIVNESLGDSAYDPTMMQDNQADYERKRTLIASSVARRNLKKSRDKYEYALYIGAVMVSLELLMDQVYEYAQNDDEL